jgi:threonine synthase
VSDGPEESRAGPSRAAPRSTLEGLRAVLPGELLEAVSPWLGLLAPTPLEWHGWLGAWLKREDLGDPPTHKRRGLLVEVALAKAAGARGVVISSSGQAAVATGAWCRRLGLPGLAFLSDRTEPAKVAAVARAGLDVALTPKPKNLSRYAARYAGLVDLRPSLHPYGAVGYRTLALELVEQLGEAPSDLFCFVNSGLTLLGAGQGFADLGAAGRIERAPGLHAVQCTASAVLAEAVGAPIRLEGAPQAGALGAQEPASLDALAEAIRATGGAVWMLRNDEVRAAGTRLRAQGLALAVEAEAALAGLERAREAGRLGPCPVVVVGAPAPAVNTVARDGEPRRDAGEGQGERAPNRVWPVTDYEDARRLLDRLFPGARRG